MMHFRYVKIPKANDIVPIRECGDFLLPGSWVPCVERHCCTSPKRESIVLSALRQVHSLGNLPVHTVKSGDTAVSIFIFNRTWSRHAAYYCGGGVRSGRNIRFNGSRECGITCNLAPKTA
jgi:hypothetical protein